MEKKQGFFSSLRDEVVRGLSPSRSRPRSRSRSASPSRSNPHMKALLWGRTKLIASSGGGGGGGGGYYLPQPKPLIGSLRPVMEGPDPDNGEVAAGEDSKRLGSGLGHWVKGQMSRAPSVTSSPPYRRSDLRLLLGVMGAPLAPVNVSSSPHLLHLSIRDSPIEYKQWILRTIEQTWNLFNKKFIALWDQNKDGPGEAYLADIYNNAEVLQLVQENYMKNLLHDSLGFGAAKMIRRIVGVAHVEDFESIELDKRRADCERNALEFGKMLLKERRKFKCIGEVVSAMQQQS